MIHNVFGLDPWCDWCDDDLDPCDHWTDAGHMDARFCSLECVARWGNACQQPQHVEGVELDLTSLKMLRRSGVAIVNDKLVVASDGTRERLQKADNAGVRL